MTARWIRCLVPASISFFASLSVTWGLEPRIVAEMNRADIGGAMVGLLFGECPMFLLGGATAALGARLVGIRPAPLVGLVAMGLMMFFGLGLGVSELASDLPRMASWPRLMSLLAGISALVAAALVDARERDMRSRKA
jgi:hypothetical protein